MSLPISQKAGHSKEERHSEAQHHIDERIVIWQRVIAISERMEYYNQDNTDTLHGIQGERAGYHHPYYNTVNHDHVA